MDYFNHHRIYALLTTGTGTAYPSGAPDFTLECLWGSCCSTFAFLCSVL